jgi:DTW domain-containing protein YfiP
MYITPLQTKTKFVILMHPKEFKKVKNNTGRFTHLLLPNSHLFVAESFDTHVKVQQIIQTHNAYVLYPTADAIALESSPPQQTQKDMAIFVLDATWACAKSMYKKSHSLQILPKISFQKSYRSSYEIKQQPSSGYLSTIESVHKVLELLEFHGIETYEEGKLTSFLEPFKKMVAYQKEKIKSPRYKKI